VINYELDAVFGRSAATHRASTSGSHECRCPKAPTYRSIVKSHLAFTFIEMAPFARRLYITAFDDVPTF
jgi:hypothetical protein